jgi:hypothetical protein
VRLLVHVLVLVLVLVLAAACGDDGAPPDGGPGGDAGPAYAPDRHCPGSAGCEDEGDGVLHAGAAAVDVTPVIDAMTDVQTVDVNGNGEFDPFEGDEFEDRNDNGRFDGVWIAGFGNGRAASGVNDPQWARAIALRRDRTTIAIVAIDCIGFFWDDVVRVRERLAGVDVDYVMIAGTHSHEARDTLGIWGATQSATGVDLDYMERLYDGAAEAVRQAVAALRPANIERASFRWRDQPGGTLRYVSDARHPIIIDDEVRILRFLEAGTETTVATLVNFGSHPEYGGDRNQLLSSDYAHWLREGIEDGVAGPGGEMAPGVGGIAVFVNGAVGSQIGPGGGLRAETWDGTPVGDEAGLVLAETVGGQMAWHVLRALGPTGGATREETAEIGFRSKELFIDVENRGYHVALLQELFITREGYNWDPELVIRPGVNEPDVRTEVAAIDIGGVQAICVPGELDPALFIGGYDGAYTPPGVDIVDPTEQNPPDLTRAPPGPYLRDLARGDAEMVMLFGLANDQIGYFVPEFDYVLHPSNPYLDEAEGEHYEETNSIGVNGWPRIRGELQMLLGWEPR